MSKERLEKARKILNHIKGYGVYDGNDDIEIFEWLIEQAERVEELEEDLLELVKQNKELRKSIAFYSSESYNAHLERLLDRSEQRNKRYREAIEKIKNKVSQQLEGLDAEEEMERVIKLSELMSISIEALEREG